MISRTRRFLLAVNYWDSKGCGGAQHHQNSAEYQYRITDQFGNTPYLSTFMAFEVHELCWHYRQLASGG